MKNPDWLCILSSVYISPYFDESEKKGRQYFSQLAEKIKPRKFSDESFYPAPPWYLSDFKQSFVLYTDGLHRYNDPPVIKRLLFGLLTFVSRKKNLDVSKLIQALNSLDTEIISLTTSDQKKLASVVKQNWKAFLEEILKSGEVRFFDFFLGDDDLLTSILESSAMKYGGKAEKWGEKLKREAGRRDMNFFPWEQFKDDHLSAYKEAKNFFIQWWNSNLLGIKDIIISYCERFPVGCYDNELVRIKDKNHSVPLTALSSALFVIEELIVFVAKVIASGPGLIVYPTANLGAKKPDESPFVVLLNILNGGDSEFFSMIKQKHQLSGSFSCLTYTHPDQQPHYPAANLSLTEKAGGDDQNTNETDTSLLSRIAALESRIELQEEKINSQKQELEELRLRLERSSQQTFVDSKGEINLGAEDFRHLAGALSLWLPLLPILNSNQFVRNSNKQNKVDGFPSSGLFYCSKMSHDDNAALRRSHSLDGSRIREYALKC